MQDRLVYENDEGGISILIPTGEVPIESVIAKDIPAGKPYRRITVADLPADRYFRDAWDADIHNLSNQAVSINMNKALAVKQQHIRVERQPYLDALDVEYMKAIESGDKSKQNAISARKQALRDATIDPKIMNAKDAQSLRDAVPDAIKFERDNKPLTR